MLHGALRPLGGARGGAGGGGGAPGPPPCPLPAALRARPGPAAPSVRRGCRPGCHGGGAGPPPGPTAGAAGGRWAAAGCRRLLQLEGQVGAGQVGAGQVGARGPGVRLRARPGRQQRERPRPRVARGDCEPRLCPAGGFSAGVSAGGCLAEPSPRGQRLVWSVPFGQGCCWSSVGFLRAVQPEVTLLKAAKLHRLGAQPASNKTIFLDEFLPAALKNK